MGSHLGWGLGRGRDECEIVRPSFASQCAACDLGGLEAVRIVAICETVTSVSHQIVHLHEELSPCASGVRILCTCT